MTHRSRGGRTTALLPLLPLAVAGPLGTVLLLAGAASAAEPGHELGLSADAVHWGDRLDAPLFAPTLSWVPGDERTAVFYVRNQSDEPADLTVAVTRTVPASGGDLGATGFLRVGARVGTAPWTDTVRGGTVDLAQRLDLGAGRVVPVTVRVALDAAAPNDTRVEADRLAFDLTLVPAVVRTGEGTGGGGDQGGEVVVGNPALGGSRGDDQGGDGVVIGGVAGQAGHGTQAGSSVSGSGSATLGGDAGTGGAGDGQGGQAGQPGAGGTLGNTGSAVPGWAVPAALLLLGTGSYLVVARRRDDEDEEVRP